MSIKKRLILLLAAILVIAAVCSLYVFVIGEDYYISKEVDDIYTFNDISVSIENDGIIEVKEIQLDEEHNVKFTVHGLKKGKANVEIHLPSGSCDYFKFYVNENGRVFRTDNFDFTGGEFVSLMILLSMVLTDIVMISCYRTLRKRADYSYSMVVYRGIGLFLFVQIVMVSLRLVTNRNIHFSAFVSMLCLCGGLFAFIMLPIALIVGIAISISNIFLIRREGFRLVNSLGIIASIMIIGAGLLSFFGSYYISGSEDYVAVMSALEIAFDYVLSYFECMLTVTVLCAYAASRYTPDFDKDYIIILGCAIRKDGTPTPILKARIDSAVAFEKKQFEKTGKHAVFVTSGGQGSDEVISESECMKRYLMEQGIPEERILKEDKSVNTFQNIKFSKAVIREHCKEEDVKVAFATTNYHVFRGYILSKKNGLNAKGISAKTKWYFFPNAFLREFVGLLVDRYKTHIVAVILILAFYVSIYLAAFYH